MMPEEVFDADNALLEDVLKGNGEEHLFKKMMELAVHAEDYPAMIFAWQNVEVFVQAIQLAQAQAAAPGGLPLPPDPLGLSAGVNVQNFKEAVLEYARAPEAPARLGTTCLPCSSSASLGYVGAMLSRLNHEPWIQRIMAVGVPNSLAIAHVYVPRASTNILERSIRNFPNSLWD
ncbi:hypothetical protein MHU86_22649 [Fragilaria crotonensis]|nr:hypothetical protein MHU86_22649 [Fragilaria crotonensis]